MHGSEAASWWRARRVRLSDYLLQHYIPTDAAEDVTYHVFNELFEALAAMLRGDK